LQVLVLFCLCVSSVHAMPGGEQVTITTQITDPIEILFQVALKEAASGNYPSSIKLLESLEQESPTPRIKLELARVLFLDHRYKESKAVFAELLRVQDLPWAVRENIRLYLEAIDDALGKVRFNFSLVSDSNPRNFTDSREVIIFGHLLRVVPPKDNKEIRGIRYSVNAARDIFGNGTFAGYLDVAFTDYEKKVFDRWVADAGLFISPRPVPKFKFKLGVEESYYGGKHYYEFPYLGLIYIPDPVYQFKFRNELKVGKLNVPDSGSFDATNLSLTSKAFRRIFKDKSMLLELYLEQSNAEETFYSYYGGGLGAEFGFEIGGSWLLYPYLSFGKRNYESADPIFRKTRHDTKKVLAVKVKKKDLSFAGFTPELILRYDENSSNIPFYSYDKVSMSLCWSGSGF